MPLAITISVTLVLLTVLIHYEGLRLISRALRMSERSQSRRKVLLAMLSVLAIHIAEIGLYAVAFWFSDIVLNLGDFQGPGVIGGFSYFYFSAESFTTLGLGDIYPEGPLRLIASLESINGLLLIGWSTSFTFLSMQRHWHFDGPDG
jgi:Ion channel